MYILFWSLLQYGPHQKCLVQDKFLWQWNTWVFERVFVVCSEDPKNFGQFNAFVVRNLIMCCAIVNHTSCSVIVLLTRGETHAMSPGEGPTSDIPTVMCSRPYCAPFIYSATRQNFWSYLIHHCIYNKLYYLCHNNKSRVEAIQFLIPSIQ